MTDPVHNAVTWFEIPVVDFARAVRFYEETFAIQLHHQQMFGQDMAFFPADQAGVGGALVKGDGYVPGASGAVVYLNGGGDLAIPLGRVTGAGGKVLVPKTALPPGMGHFAHFEDSEGNRVGLYSVN
jgi:hypothetical protein